MLCSINSTAAVTWRFFTSHCPSSFPNLFPKKERHTYKQPSKKSINGRSNARGGTFRFAAFSVDGYQKDAPYTEATPDGRLAGDLISKNFCATSGCDSKGVTGLIQSCLQFDQKRCPGGNVLDLILHPSSVAGDAGLSAMKSLVHVYLTGGGMAMQMNVVNAETLRAAQQEPDKYKSLQIRLCGWNVYSPVWPKNSRTI